MKKIRILALLLLLLLLFTACTNGAGKSHRYDDGHTHIYGNRYTVTEMSCVTAGSAMRSCRICHQVMEEVVPVPEALAARNHSFLDTVVAPTESTEGYTARVCTLCPYTVDRANVVPALYALLTNESTIALPPTGVTGIMMSDTESHVLAYSAGGVRQVPAELAARLAFLLTVTELLAASEGTLTESTEVPLLSGPLEGNTYTVSELCAEYMASGNIHVAESLAMALANSLGGFRTAVTARLTKLGVANAVELDVLSQNTPGTATLHATAVMLTRALDEPLIVAVFQSAVQADYRLVRINGQRPDMYFSDTALRVSAISMPDGGYRFLLLTGDTLPAGVENTLYAE